MHVNAARIILTSHGHTDPVLHHYPVFHPKVWFKNRRAKYRKQEKDARNSKSRSSSGVESSKVNNEVNANQKSNTTQSRGLAVPPSINLTPANSENSTSPKHHSTAPATQSQRSSPPALPCPLQFSASSSSHRPLYTSSYQLPHYHQSHGSMSPESGNHLHGSSFHDYNAHAMQVRGNSPYYAHVNMPLSSSVDTWRSRALLQNREHGWTQ